MFFCPLQKNIFLLKGGKGQGGGERDVLLSSAKKIYSCWRGLRGRGEESAMFFCSLQKYFLVGEG